MLDRICTAIAALRGRPIISGVTYRALDLDGPANARLLFTGNSYSTTT